MLDMSAIPISLKPFFQEYDISKFTSENDSHTIRVHKNITSLSSVIASRYLAKQSPYCERDCFVGKCTLLAMTEVINLHTIIERVLQFENRVEIKWLFSTYSNQMVIDWIKEFGKDKLPQPHLNFWQIVLEIDNTKTNKEKITSIKIYCAE